MKRFIQISLLSFAVAVSARAETTIVLSQTNTFSGLTSGATTLSFNLLETARGSSVQLSDIVSISINGIINKSAGSYTLTNPSFSQFTVDVKRQTRGWFSSIAPIGFTGSSSSPNLFTDYNVQDTFVGSTKTGNYRTASTGDLGGLLDASSFSQFLGAGTFDVLVNAAQLDTTQTTFFGTTVYRVDSAPALSGNVVVTYEVVPEPSVLSLLTVGLAGVIALRRLRRKI